MDLDVDHVDPRFRGHLSLRYRAPEYVFRILGVRARPAKT
jgi:hypothetical protein